MPDVTQSPDQAKRAICAKRAIASDDGSQTRRVSPLTVPAKPSGSATVDDDAVGCLGRHGESADGRGPRPGDRPDRLRVVDVLGVHQGERPTGTARPAVTVVDVLGEGGDDRVVGCAGAARHACSWRG
ncbi:hypothetical protein [Curtobacterium flaccumfaciens]|uniref:hypothetical protein n=1 Tax=Curtobacterium flaccumfaciens TaxID=2035 RepID=UPI0039946644